MVTKMTKYSFILLSGMKDTFLEQLQELGVVDITRSRRPIDENSALMLSRADEKVKMISRLSSLDFSGESLADVKVNISGDLVQAAKEAFEKTDALKASLTAQTRELANRKAWGTYDGEALKAIEQQGYTIRFYTCPAKRFDESWAQEYALEKINEDGRNVWFVTVAPADAEYSFPLDEAGAPKGPASECEENIKAINADILTQKAILAEICRRLPELEKEQGEELCSLDLYLAKAAGESAAENYVSVITGFAPQENEAELVQRFDEMGVLYIKEDAKEEDNPPIKLKNNRFTRMFEVLTGMYGSPVYGEFDPTPILAPFFLLFFAMCMGDAGYGLLLIIIGTAIAKGWVKIDMFDGLGPLITTLGVGTAVVGTVLGTFFGISLADAAWVPEWLKSIMIVGDVNVLGMTLNIQMVLAVGIGVFHICLAMIIKAIGYTRRFGFKQNISTWGWLILILGGLIITALATAGLMSGSVTKWAVIALGIISGLGIYVFNTPGRNPLINIGAGLWDTYNMVTGLLGDVLSYIRLFALGLAGGMLGKAFNELGLMILGDNATWQWLPFILIIILGHVLNLAMSCLGAFVHPLRLTFVEYFKNAGYEGKGVAYKPLKKANN